MKTGWARWAGAAVLFAAVAAPVRAAPAPAATEVAVFSGGCFWGVQAVFEHVKGVISAESGYTGGAESNAQYETVSYGNTGHAESVRVVFDPSQVSYQQLLAVFFRVVHDPTQLNRQGPDDGTQYRSAVWYTSAAQRQEAERYIAGLETSRIFKKPIVTTVKPLMGFYPAEAYHQDYYVRHPDALYIVYNDVPKVKALKRDFPSLWRDDPVLLTAGSPTR